jgi:hypothetical protein
MGYHRIIFSKDQVFSAEALHAWLEFCYGASKYHGFPPSCDPCPLNERDDDCENCVHREYVEPDLTIHMKVRQLAVIYNESTLANYAHQRFADENFCLFNGNSSWKLHEDYFTTELWQELADMVRYLYHRGNYLRHYGLVKNVVRVARRLCRALGPQRFAEEKDRLELLEEFPSFATDLALASLWAE